MSDKPPTATKPAVVRKIVESLHPEIPEKAESSSRIAKSSSANYESLNTLRDENGVEVKLKLGARVEVIVEAEVTKTIPKRSRTE